MRPARAWPCSRTGCLGFSESRGAAVCNRDSHPSQTNCMHEITLLHIMPPTRCCAPAARARAWACTREYWVPWAAVAIVDIVDLDLCARVRQRAPTQNAFNITCPSWPSCHSYPPSVHMRATSSVVLHQHNKLTCTRSCTHVLNFHHTTPHPIQCG
jgi:hypothetical protein